MDAGAVKRVSVRDALQRALSQTGSASRLPEQGRDAVSVTSTANAGAARSIRSANAATNRIRHAS